MGSAMFARWMAGFMKKQPNHRVELTSGILTAKVGCRHPEVGSAPEGDRVPPLATHSECWVSRR